MSSTPPRLAVSDLEALLAVGHEVPGVEFKGPGNRVEKAFLAKVVRAVIGMANRRGGGYVIIGVSERDDGAFATGLDPLAVRTWTQEETAGCVNSYADPHVSIDVQQISVGTSVVIIIAVAEFDDVPILCAKSYPNVLRDGACYIRRRGRVETTDIPTSSEMRTLLDLATEKSLRRFIQVGMRGGLRIASDLLQTHAERYASELEGFE